MPFVFVGADICFDSISFREPKSKHMWNIFRLLMGAHQRQHQRQQQCPLECLKCDGYRSDRYSDDVFRARRASNNRLDSHFPFFFFRMTFRTGRKKSVWWKKVSIGFFSFWFVLLMNVTRQGRDIPRHFTRTWIVEFENSHIYSVSLLLPVLAVLRFRLLWILATTTVPKQQLSKRKWKLSGIFSKLIQFSKRNNKKNNEIYEVFLVIHSTRLEICILKHNSPSFVGDFNLLQLHACDIETCIHTAAATIQMHIGKWKASKHETNRNKRQTAKALSNSFELAPSKRGDSIPTFTFS